MNQKVDHRIGALYNNETGRVIATISCSSNAGLLLQLSGRGPEVSLYQGAIKAEQYMDLTQSPPAPMDKQELLADFDTLSIEADNASQAILRGLPNPTIVTENKIEYEVTDGSFIFQADSIGDYRIKATSIKFLGKEWTINAS